VLRAGDGVTRVREPILLAADDPLSAPHKPICEVIGLALDRRIEYFDGLGAGLLRCCGRKISQTF